MEKGGDDEMSPAMADQALVRHREMTKESMTLVEALHTIVTESDDAEVVRIAMSALTGTNMGRAYLAANPLRY